MHPDHQPYFGFTTRARLEKSVNSLIGIIQGIAIDGRINQTELDFLDIWMSQHEGLRDRHPYNELMPKVESALADRVLTDEEREDLVWLCERVTSADFYDRVTVDLQRLHAILGGIVADTQITEDELRGLSDWLDEHDHLKTCWPYDEVASSITGVLADKKIDEDEHTMLLRLFSEFVELFDGKTIINGVIQTGTSISGLCAVCPEITFGDKSFCFTGASAKYTRKQIAEIVTQLGGGFHDNMSGKVNFLVIGADGNPCWAYACYGRKVEKAVELRKAGHRVLIVHEHDFHDAVADHG